MRSHRTTTGMPRRGPAPSSSLDSSSSSASPRALRPAPVSDSAAIDREVPISSIHVESGPRPTVVAVRPAEERSVTVATTTPITIAVESLDAYYGPTRAVRDITFGVNTGQVTAMIGP